ncbi:MAG TPA: MarP family serine protease [Gaiellaceae bacterium]|nr:MarP family serine protease [Gaiellaceae bacterium]
MSLTTVDWIALALIGLMAVGGLRRGLIATALSLAGLVAGAYLGSRAAPHVLHGGAGSPWTPLAGLGGAVVGALLLQTVAGIAGSFVRGGLKLTPFRFFDSLGGLVLGAGMGVVLVWVVGASALLIPGQPSLRRAVQQSQIVRRLDEAVSPSRLLHLLARIDPFPSITGPQAPAAPPAPAIARVPAVGRAEGSVVRILGNACGVGVEGSGWFAARDLVVTAAHVVAGENGTTVQFPHGLGYRQATVVAFDSGNDIAVLRIQGAPPVAPLRLRDSRPGAAVGIIGYPENGPLTVTPGRIGRTAVVFTRDIYGHGPVPRTITAIAGRVRHGDSGAPAVDASGAVESTIFAARIGAPSGYGVPASVVRRVLDSAGAVAVSTGACATG